MNKIIVNQSFWEIFPEAVIEVLVVKGIDNHTNKEKKKQFQQLLNDAANKARTYLTEETFSQNEIIVQWRQAFSRFKTKKGARSSIEALLKRVNQRREFFPINPLVDIYNSISLKYGVPCGGEDIEKIKGNLYLGKAQGGESFFPLGAADDAPALPEEIIYYDDEGAICRSFNWREAQRTMLTENTTQAVLVIESVNQEQAIRGGQAIMELKNNIDQIFNVTSIRDTLTKNYSEITIQ
ncbi:phenylalanine--tRNA ligase beta subunit-related protein [Enterococcus ratti]|uniref:B3/B4 domain-containing protein n=1 Tax=Enterococcus ratti TaxID=150033 RepID=UPI0035127C68